MKYQELREELRAYYWEKADRRAEAFLEKCTKELDSKANSTMSPYQMKALQYETITELFDPVVFRHSPFYYETGTMGAHCDGARDFRHTHHAGGWTYWRNSHLFIEQDPELCQKKQRQADALFYLVCGPFNDVSQHFVFHYRPILENGLKGVYEKAREALKTAETAEQTEFLQAVCTGLLCLKKMSEKFAQKAKKLADAESDPVLKSNLLCISETASRTPWEKPGSFYEALNCLAFFRKAVGALEGVGFSSFGRVDLDLYPFYQADLEAGRITEAQAYAYICQFLITFDMHYDHDMKMVGYADHELENTYVLGGCDREGKPVYNPLTRMFLQAAREEQIIYPKIKCRFSAESPKAYLDEIDRAVIAGTSTVLYQNDDATIPALIRAGRTEAEARDYLISGCWDVQCCGVEKFDCGSYVTILKPFEYSIHRLDREMEHVGMYFAPIDEAESFEEVYRITLENINTLFRERAAVTKAGGNIWHKVDPLPLFSSTLCDCIEKKTDYTAGGARYRDDHYMCFGFPNLVDSLLAIKELCFDSQKYTLAQLLTALRHNWDGYEETRSAAIRCHGWGDGSTESCRFAAAFHEDLYRLTQQLTGTYGGKVHLGHLTYTEVRWWGEKTLATPDGRYNGDYLAQGLTPSRLKKIPAVTSVINSLAALDGSAIAGNSVVNVILPAGKIDLDTCAWFLRSAAKSALMSLQLNCTTKEQLLDAQKHPEQYPNLIIRVTGFSAKFTSLSPQWQQEVLTRNFYE